MVRNFVAVGLLFQATARSPPPTLAQQLWFDTRAAIVNGENIPWEPETSFHFDPCFNEIRVVTLKHRTSLPLFVSSLRSLEVLNPEGGETQLTQR